MRLDNHERAIRKLAEICQFDSELAWFSNRLTQMASEGRLDTSELMGALRIAARDRATNGSEAGPFFWQAGPELAVTLSFEDEMAEFSLRFHNRYQGKRHADILVQVSAHECRVARAKFSNAYQERIAEAAELVEPLLELIESERLPLPPPSLAILGWQRYSVLNEHQPITHARLLKSWKELCKQNSLPSKGRVRELSPLT